MTAIRSGALILPANSDVPQVGQRNGYLSNETWVLALATFLSLTKRRGQADKWLKPDVAALLPKADRYLARRPDLLEPLLAIS